MIISSIWINYCLMKQDNNINTISQQMNDNKIRKNTCFISARTQQLQLIDDLDSIRIMNNCFNSSLIKFIKQNKNCLGDIQDLSKAKVSKQDQLLSEQTKQKLFLKFLERMKKEMTFKNSSMFKTYNQYDSTYRQHFQPSKQIEQQDIENEEPQKQVQIDKMCQKSFQKQTKKTTRPMSSTIGRFRNKATFSYQNRFNRTTYCNNGLDLEAFQYISVSNTTNIQVQRKKANSQINTNRQRVKSFVIQNSQVFIQDGCSENCNLVGNTKYSKQNIYKYGLTNKCVKKQQIRAKISQRVDLEQIERQQIKNKILMVNSVLAVNLARSQGYKPKSLCRNKYYL